MTTTTLPFHPLADIFPLMEGEEFNAFVADIKANGLRELITVYQNKILDGRNRYHALRALGIEPRLTPFTGDDEAARAFVISKNLHRRHLTAEKRRELIADLIKAQPEKSDRAIAEPLKVSPTTVGTVRADLVEKGQVSKLDTRTDKRGRKQPARKGWSPERWRRHKEKKKAKPKISKASSEFANLVIDTVLPKVEAGKTAATSADDAAACDLDLAEQLQAAKIKIAGLESEVEELKAENAELRTKLEAAACTPAGDGAAPSKFY